MWCFLNVVMTEWRMAHSPIIFDRKLLRARRRRAERLGASDFLIERVAEDVAERLAVVLRQFEVAVDLGTPGDAVRRALMASDKVGAIVSASAWARGPLAVVADEEALPFRDGAIDLVVSALSLQFANDLPGVLVQIRRALRPDGLLLAALVGGDTLTELRQAFAQAEAEVEDGISPRVAPFADKHRITVAYHGHANLTDPDEVATPESFATCLSHSKFHAINLDIGHFTAAGFDPVTFLQKNHARVTHLHLKDRQSAAHGGANLPWGQGDTPIKAVLQLLSREKWDMPAYIEFEYPGDPLVEIPRCFQFCKDALGVP